MKSKNIDPLQIWDQLDQWFQRYDYHLVCGSIEKEQLKSYVYISGTTGSNGLDQNLEWVIIFGFHSHL